MLFKCFLFLFVTLSTCCFAERYINPTKYDDQKEVLFQGGVILLSEKHNAVQMYHTSETISDRKGNFYFELINKTNEPINFYFSDLRVTDQTGRPVKIIPKKKLIADKKSEKNWKAFYSVIHTTAETLKARDAGIITYEENSQDRFDASFKTRDRNGIAQGSVSSASSSTTNGTMYSEALRQQALRDVQEDAEKRDRLIQSTYEDWVYGLNNFYFDSTTVFPGASYAANFQIELDKKVEKKLQYLLFHFNIGGEVHTFSFYCGKEKKKWYQWGK